MATHALSDYDRHLLGEGSHLRSYEQLGAHLGQRQGEAGVRFALWAPNASRVAVIGDFNGWDPAADPMTSRDGIWEHFVPGLGQGDLYKYRVVSANGAYQADKTDPYGFAAELRPQTASKIWDLDRYVWNDQSWMRTRGLRQSAEAPIAVYEVHLGSWRRGPGGRWLSYVEVAEPLADYVAGMGFTHVELLPLSEHPFDGSWGYQPVGYFAPTSRFGTPDDLRALIDQLHQRGVGVILDWVPAHFPRDGHGLSYFDGTHLFEHADPRQGAHPEWGTLVFNYGRLEVQNFLLANALFWLEQYHVDGLRVDAVASMLYLDYGRRAGEWIPNRYGGHENLEAVAFLRRFNDTVHERFPDVITIAEESTAWPMVSRPTHLGGLGFDLKWNMGWMHDLLDYTSQDPVYRAHHHHRLTFGLVYAFSEHFVLPFSHDEVVHGKGSMIGRMPGDEWRRFANLRLLYGYMTAHPGRKLLFMGNEFGQEREWNHDAGLDWHLLEAAPHHGLQRWVRDLNTLYRGEPALHQLDGDAAGFEWIDCQDHERSVVSFIRRSRDGAPAICVCNFTPVPRPNYRIGAPVGGRWGERLNSDAALYGGSGMGNGGSVTASPVPAHGRPHSLNLTLPPLGMLLFTPDSPEGAA